MKTPTEIMEEAVGQAAIAVFREDKANGPQAAVDLLDPAISVLVGMKHDLLRRVKPGAWPLSAARNDALEEAEMYFTEVVAEHIRALKGEKAG